MSQTARRDGDAELGPQQMRDLRERDPQMRVQPYDQRDGLRAQLHAGRPQRVGGLQPVPALHAPTTLRAMAHLDVEASHDGAHHRNVFLVLRRHARHCHRTATVRTRRRRRRAVGCIHARRPSSAGPPSVLRTATTARTAAATLRVVLREGRRLSKSRPPRRIDVGEL